MPIYHIPKPLSHLGRGVARCAYKRPGNDESRGLSHAFAIVLYTSLTDCADSRDLKIATLERVPLPVEHKLTTRDKTPIPFTAGSASLLRRFLSLFRACEWWEYKLLPILSVYYATLLRTGASLTAALPQTLQLLFALALGAAYVSLINDLSDREDDRRAGKANRCSGMAKWLILLLIGITVAGGLFFVRLWRGTHFLVVAYVAAWTAFSLYSLPPMRLKDRGALGVLADAAGAHLLPTLVAVLFAFRVSGDLTDPLWLAGAASWSAAYGLRGILWHQMADEKFDRRIGARSFVCRFGEHATRKLTALFVFPVEVLGLFVMVWRIGDVLIFLALAMYALFTIAKIQAFRMRAVLVTPGPRVTIIMSEYYQVFFPISVLLTMAWKNSADWLAFAANCVLFPRLLSRSILDGATLVRTLIWHNAGSEA